MDLESLISQVFAAVVVWDAKEPKHCDRQFIAKQWDGIAAKLGVECKYLLEMMRF